MIDMGFFKRRGKNVIEQAITKEYGGGRTLGKRIKESISKRITEHQEVKRKEKKIYAAAFESERKKALVTKGKRDAREKTLAPSLFERIASNIDKKPTVKKIKKKRLKKPKDDFFWEP